jgi:hypothetical protein
MLIMDFPYVIVNDMPVLAVDVEPIMGFLRENVESFESFEKIAKWILAKIEGFEGEDWAFAPFLHDAGTVTSLEGETIRAYILTVMSGPHMNVKKPTAKQKREAIDQLQMKMAYLQLNENMKIVDIHEAIETN